MAAQGLNRINIVIPPLGGSAALLRDDSIADLQAALGGVSARLWHYTDTNSGMGLWSYLAVMYGFISGIFTVATVSCSGMVTPPSGSDTKAIADPGAGAYTWVATSALPIISTPGGGGGGSAPAQNSNGYIWRIAGNSSTAAADFTTAINAVSAVMPVWTVNILLKYVDSVSGAWQVYSLWFSPGIGNTNVASWSNSNIMYVVTCAGTPHPVTGSGLPAVTLPSFTQTFTTLTAPLSFGPMR